MIKRLFVKASRTYVAYGPFTTCTDKSFAKPTQTLRSMENLTLELKYSKKMVKLIGHKFGGSMVLVMRIKEAHEPCAYGGVRQYWLQYSGVTT